MSISLQLQILIKESSDYADLYNRWSVYLQGKENDSQAYLEQLIVFLERFPFSFTHWVKFLTLSAESPGKVHLMSLEHLPKSIDLWKMHLEHIKTLGNPTLYKKQLERAILEVGADPHTFDIFEEYYSLITDDVSKWQFFKKLFTRNLIGLEKFKQRFDEWIVGVPKDKLQIILTKETRAVVKLQHSPVEYLKMEVDKLFQKSVINRQQRVKELDKISCMYFDGSKERADELPYWKNYISVVRKQGVVEIISFCYEQALACQTEHLELWQQAFHYLQNETGKHDRVLAILRSNPTFFKHFNNHLYFYWCDLEQRLNVKVARKMYIDLEQATSKQTPSASNIQVYFRHIQFQLRDNSNITNAKNLYDAMLLRYYSDLQLLSYILVEYANFLKEKYKNIDTPKNLLHTYFEAMPFNEYLFINYLQFFRHFQNIEGYYDGLMNIVSMGMTKARKSISQLEYPAIVARIKNYLRGALSSIYLIKMSDKKMIEIEEKIRLQDH